MAKDVLKTKAVKEALAANKPKKLFDGEGLVLDIRSSTSASWEFHFVDGKPDQVGLGSFFKLTPIVDGQVNFKAARDLRIRCALLLTEGRNPKEVLREEKQEKRLAAAAPRGLVIGEYIKANIHLIAKRAKSERQKQSWINSLQFNRIGAIANMTPHQVTDAHAIALMEDYYERAPVMADDVRQRLYRLLNVAVKTPGWRNPFRWEGHLDDKVVRSTEEISHASLPHDLIGAFVARIRGENERVIMALGLEWMILSMNRPSEACGADWSEIQWEEGCWVIPEERMKMRREHAVPLTERHYEILAKLKPLDGNEEYPASGPIFVAQGHKSISRTGLQDYMKSVQIDGKPCIDPTNGKPITPHGFRSTFRTWAEEQLREDGTGNLYEEKVMEACIAHITGDATRNKYVRSKAVAVRCHITEAWGDYCAIVRQPKAAPLRMRRAA